jgi:hypothetical protein
MIELQLSQTVAILKKFIPDYDPARAAIFAAQVGVSIPENLPNVPAPPPPGLGMLTYSPSQSGSDSFSLRSPVDGISPSTPPTPYFRPPNYTYSSHPHVAQDNGLHTMRDGEADNGQKGRDPRGRNMANPTAIARSFGVTSRILDEQSYHDPGKYTLPVSSIASHLIVSRTTKGRG